MKYRKTLSTGKHPNSKFRHIFIDYPYGYSLLLKGVEVGRFLIREEKYSNGLKIFFLEGMEIDPEYRNRGIGKALIKLLGERVDMIVGSITEDEAKPFWLKVGAEFRDLPKDSFPKHLVHTVTSEEPVFFFITKNPKAKKMAENMAKFIPQAMKAPRMYV